MPTTPSILSGRAVLITGGTGSFGTAFARHALDQGARRVAIFSRGEAKQAAMAAELSDTRLRFMIGDVRDERRVMDAMRGVDVTVHAAALKRVEQCEADPAEAVATNILGTMHVARACIERGVQKAVFLSTDKAAAPNTLYGSTKLTAERLWLACNTYAAGTGTRFSASRYGNVAQSTGSVIPLWKSQVAAGRPLTITDERMTRFLMSMSQAIDLVLLALRDMTGGEVFIPKIGATTMLDLARALVERPLPYPPGHVVVGVRPGEKLHEMLISSDESRNTHDAGTHYVISHDGAAGWGAILPCVFPPVPRGFEFRSDTARALSRSELEELVT